MTAADARRIVEDLELDAHVARIVSDAPSLSEGQLAVLRSIFGGGDG